MAGRFLLALALAGMAGYFQVFGAVQRITIYQYRNQTGEGIVLTGKYPNTTHLKYLLHSMLEDGGSYCAVGIWDLFLLPHYIWEGIYYYSAGGGEEEVCDTFQYFPPMWTESLRHIGPPDTSTPAIALYETSFSPNGNGYSHERGGREYVVTDMAGKDLTFTPRHGVLFGNSSWTLFSGDYFDGESICFRPNLTGIMTGRMYFSPTFIPWSVVRGCDFEEVQENIQAFNNQADA